MIKEVSRIDRIKQKIKKIETEYQNIIGLILSEDDLKCLIYKELHDLYSKPIKTIDYNIKAIQLHTEIKWFDKNRNLKYRPDISIIDPNYLSLIKSFKTLTTTNDIPICSKGFEFNSKNSIIIEIKFFKNPMGLTKGNIKLVEKDIEKLNNLIDLQGSIIQCLIIIFCRTNKNKNNFNKIREKYSNVDNIHLIYGTGNFIKEKK